VLAETGPTVGKAKRGGGGARQNKSRHVGEVSPQHPEKCITEEKPQLGSIKEQRKVRLGIREKFTRPETRVVYEKVNNGLIRMTIIIIVRKTFE